MNPPVSVRIDFVSDVSCPWCAIGLASLQQALAKLDGEVSAEIHFQPFELNPQLPAEGEDSTEHLARKYGSSAQQIDANREMIRERGAAVGFTFNMDRRSRVYNTFDAHRLLHWAALEGKELALKQALLRAYFTDGENVSAHDTLVRLANSVGLDATRAAQILAGDIYAEEVRRQERHYVSRGIQSVPATIVNDRHLISGGQPPEAFEQALRQVAATKKSDATSAQHD
ncbi:MAG: DsbA family oxidoreductase [Rhodanobacter sp.]|nr:MAG: DsbA family oxidoreductase [Rhodanobacter sp.]TAL99239.1 MAG: DsbA family oxidoreductase [Rhodanobacter sp.]TAM42272.1 MAG: DsbA family oxidoreductase [Rhodanobacter sp.]